MDPERAAQIDDLELRLHHLRTIRQRLASTSRIEPGTSTFWSGIARNRYEDAVVRLSSALDAADHSLALCIAVTGQRISALRHD